MKTSSFNTITHVIVSLTLMYHIGILDFLGSKAILLVCFYGILLLSLASWMFFIKDRKVTRFDIGIICFAFIFPVIFSMRSMAVFDQPFLYGIAAMRYWLFILFGYFLYLVNYDYRLLLKQINVINISVAALSVIALYVFKIDSTVVGSFMATTDSVDITAKEDIVKGVKLTVCSEMMFVSYVYYLLRFLSKPSNIKNLAILFILMVYLVFVHKGRQSFASLAVIYVAYCFSIRKRITRRQLIVFLLPVLVVPTIIFAGKGLLNGFLSMFGASDTSDASTLARLEGISLLMPYIGHNILLGFGNLSHQFMGGGFHHFFNSTFYISDLGILGAMAMGGVLFLSLYAFLYSHIWKKSRNLISEFHSRFIRYFIIFCISLLFIGNDILYADKSLTFAFLFYPFFGYKNPNVFFFRRIQK